MQTHFEQMKRWEDFLESIAENHIVSYSRFGDWASPYGECDGGAFGSGAVSANTPGTFMSTGYSYYNCCLLSKIAAVLGFEDDRKKYEDLREQIKAAILDRFYDSEKKIFCKGSQGSYAFALKLGIVPDIDREIFITNFLNEIERCDYHLTTGNQTTKYLLEQLTEIGREDAAMRILLQKSYPSWGYMLENRATTIWERWEYETGKEMNSHDHPMHAAPAAWLFKYLVGIRPDESEPGFRLVKICPCFPTEIGEAAASLDTVRGTISFRWKKRGKVLKMFALIPAGCRGEIRFRWGKNSKVTCAGKEYRLRTENEFSIVLLGAGEYELTVTDR